MKRSALAFAALAVLAGCASNRLPEIVGPDVELVVARYPGTTLDELTHGRELYRRRCSGCHRPVQPRELSAERWPAVIAAMSERAGLSSSEAQAIERYAVAISMRSN